MFVPPMELKTDFEELLTISPRENIEFQDARGNMKRLRETGELKFAKSLLGVVKEQA